LAGKERAVPVVLLAVLFAATAYEAGVALRLLPLGDEPGEGPAGRGLLFGAALLALVVAAVFSAVSASRASTPAGPAIALIDLSAAAFLVARFYSFDPYFAPTLRRFSEGGVAAPWVYSLVALALVAAVLPWTRPRAGLGLTVLVLPLVAVTAFATGLGH
jgi:hypothetical protein